jgi:hypothetical protein
MEKKWLGDKTAAESDSVAGPATTPTRPHKAIIPFIPVSTRAHTLSTVKLY